jgi:hypothetical protein
MSVNAITNNTVHTQYQPTSTGDESKEIRAKPDHDGDSDDSAQTTKSPSVNANGSVVGSVVDVKV